ARRRTGAVDQIAALKHDVEHRGLLVLTRARSFADPRLAERLDDPDRDTEVLEAAVLLAEGVPPLLMVEEAVGGFVGDHFLELTVVAGSLGGRLGTPGLVEELVDGRVAVAVEVAAARRMERRVAHVVGVGGAGPRREREIELSLA